MTGQDTTTTVGQLPDAAVDAPRRPAILTGLVWTLFLASVAALLARVTVGFGPSVPGLLAVDGLTVALWTAVTGFSGIVHSYSRRYMAGDAGIERFFHGLSAFTAAVLVLVAATNLALFWAAWLAMGLVMASLIGHVRDWEQARAAARLARRYFLASSGALGVALLAIWWTTGATTVSGAAAAATLPPAWLAVVAGALIVAAAIQSALLPFHTWLLSSMTAPTPASALMHAGFVNAGGILLVRFAPVVGAEPTIPLAVLTLGGASALGGKLLKTVQTDVKGRLGCSTVGQMGFMLVQVGLGFPAAAIAHLILHGCYKAYQFLASGAAVEQTTPGGHHGGSPGAVGWFVAILTAAISGALFALVTGKGLAADSGLLLAGIVVLTTFHAAREAVRESGLPARVRYLATPLLVLPAVGLYALVYRGMAGLLAGVPGVGSGVALTPLHVLVGVAFLGAYVAIETGVYRRSRRLYVALVNVGQPPADTLTTTEDYNDY